MATIHDVARVAGVSTSTVSYVLSGKRSISASTRARVERAIKDLGYRPHAGARALASSRTNVLGLVVPLRADVNVAVIMEFVRAVVTRARTYDHDVLVLTKEEPSGLERVTDGAIVDAVIVMDIESEDPRIDLLTRIERPVVLIGVPNDARGLSCVDFDFRRASGLAVRLGFMEDTVIAFRGLEWKFSKPVYINDTVRLRVKVADKKPMERLGGGLVNFDMAVVNHEEQVVAKGVWELLCKSRGGAA